MFFFFLFTCDVETEAFDERADLVARRALEHLVMMLASQRQVERGLDRVHNGLRGRRLQLERLGCLVRHLPRDIGQRVAALGHANGAQFAALDRRSDRCSTFVVRVQQLECLGWICGEELRSSVHLFNSNSIKSKRLT